MKNNLKDINNRITLALEKAGRKDDVSLVAVTKTLPVERIVEALDLGITDIGENKVQELTDKMAILGDRPRYHMIGHLQSNKVKYIVDNVHLIHSLDRISLANEIDKRGKASNRILDTLIQVNISQEDSKFGMMEDEVIPFIEKVLKMENINIKGLMTIAPFTEDESVLRNTFSGLYDLSERVKAQKYKELSMDILSMGMTNDFEIAIEEGSNMIRVGTGIFGKRNY
ncbi:YggS family pyridoxal phosphate-dependent enzyme [Gudongella sp. SC589]|uniref:YggS family pyridoxal phosphate-dependent enzyme n=1 Tax=Gudongella sp. SC589 TaxID=3385990 RepID=UPI003904B220